MIKTVSLALLCALIAGQASAADIRFMRSKLGPNCASIEVDGELVRGDADMLSAFIKRNKTGCAGVRINPAVIFDSPGGDLSESFKMGRLIRNNQLGTAVQSNGTCISACNFAFMGGVTRTMNGQFGIHRPFSTANNKESRAAESSFASMERQVNVYAAEMRASPLLIDYMMKISPSKVLFLTPEEVVRYGVSGKDPVWEEQMLSRRAEQFGISKMELMRRLELQTPLCGESYAETQACRDFVIANGHAPP